MDPSTSLTEWKTVVLGIDREYPADNSVGGTARQPEDEYQHLYAPFAPRHGVDPHKACSGVHSGIHDYGDNQVWRHFHFQKTDDALAQ